MILGIGTDICAVDRIKEAIAERILTPEEMKSFQQKKSKQNFLAKRFAAKEAVSKAFGVGIGKTLSFKDIEIQNNEKGQPFVNISDEAKKKLPQFSNIHISISDEKHYAVAFVIVEDSKK